MITPAWPKLSQEDFPATDDDHPLPDILLIDGGKGQLHAALSALEHTPQRPGLVISLAEREEEIYVPGRDENR